ncbi:MAG: hypothetical protein ACOCUH_01480 [Bacteriovoracia bacterium]
MKLKMMITTIMAMALFSLSAFAELNKEKDKSIGSYEETEKAEKQHQKEQDRGISSEEDQAQTEQKMEDTEKKQELAEVKKQDKSLQGKITKTKAVTPQGSDQKSLIVFIETEQKDNMVVDLGPKDDLSDYEINEGANIRVEGRLVSIDGKEFLMADEIWLGYDKVQINRWGQRMPASEDEKMKEKREPASAEQEDEDL